MDFIVGRPDLNGAKSSQTKQFIVILQTYIQLMSVSASHFCIKESTFFGLEKLCSAGLRISEGSSKRSTMDGTRIEGKGRAGMMLVKCVKLHTL